MTVRGRSSIRAALPALLLLWLLLALFAPVVWAQQGLQPVPALTARVMDQTRTLSAAQAEALEAKLARLEADKGSQVVLLMVATTAPEDIAAYANRVGQSWKIGRQEVGDGLIVVVAKDDRRMRIEVAKALEGAVPDIAAGRIINNVMTPFFREGDFYGGLDAALDQLAARIRGEPLPPVHTPDAAPPSNGVDWFGLLFLIFIFVPIINAIARHALGRKLGALATGGGIGALAFFMTFSIAVAVLAAFAAIFISLTGRTSLGLPGGRHRGGWGGGGGGSMGGGFGSGGGGSFGGGGASGRW